MLFLKKTGATLLRGVILTYSVAALVALTGMLIGAPFVAAFANAAILWLPLFVLFGMFIS